VAKEITCFAINFEFLNKTLKLLLAIFELKICYMDLKIYIYFFKMTVFHRAALNHSCFMGLSVRYAETKGAYLVCDLLMMRHLYG